MDIIREDPVLVVKLDRGEEVMTSLARLVTDQNLSGASFSGIGAVSHANIGFYRIAGKRYEAVDFEENLDRIQQSIRTHESIQSAASDLLSISDDSSLMPGAEEVDLLLVQVFLAATSVHMSNGSLQALLSSGRLDILRNEELRGLLAAWPSWVEENAEDEQWLINDVQQRLSPYLNSSVRARARERRCDT